MQIFRGEWEQLSSICRAFKQRQALWDEFWCLDRFPAVKAVGGPKALWRQHVLQDHYPRSRDCFLCQQAIAQSKPHRRCRHPQLGVLSLDLAGPYKTGYDGFAHEGTRDHEPKPRAATLCKYCDGMNALGWAIFFCHLHTTSKSWTLLLYNTPDELTSQQSERAITFKFRRSMFDYAFSKFKMKSLVIDLYELPKNKPCFVLFMCRSNEWVE